ncbi:choice-of-anchor D domain-containing protein [Archangium gephyra]|nr:choice-of-anchor D domain-containing protein [Archangium gephyra]
MLRPGVLTVLFLGLLTACGPAEPNGPGEGSSNSDVIISIPGSTRGLAAEVSSTNLSFGQQRVGTSSTRTIELKNNGPTTLSVSSVAISGPGTVFSISPVSPFTMPAWTTRTLLVTFSPTVESVFSGTLTFTTSDPTTPTLAIPLSGTGVKPVLVVSPTLLHFGEQHVGTSSSPLLVSLVNAGSGPLTLSSLSISGAAAFTVDSPTMPYVLTPGMPLALLVRFNPTAEGPVSGTLSLTTIDPDYSSVSVPLMGVGVRPRLIVEPTLLDFGEQHVGTTSLRVVRLRNIGSGSLVISSATLSGAPFFLIAPPTMPFTLPAGESQELMVGFSPPLVGIVTGTLSLSTNDAVSPMFAIPMAGTGIGSGSGLVFEPSSLDFGAQSVGTSSTRVVTVTNVSFSPLFLTSLSLTASVYPSFSSTTLPAIPFYLSPGSSLSFLVTFNPGGVGSVTGTLQLTTNDPFVSAPTLPLSGSGVSTLLGGL